MPKTVPPAPEPEKIDHKSKRNLTKWIAYFRALSPRIQIYKANDSDSFEKFLERCRGFALEYHTIEEEYYTLIWPKKEEVAFVLFIDSSKTGRCPEFKTNNYFIFTFENIAFGLSYFELEGDPEDHDRDTFSLRGMSCDALSWKYVGQTIIPSRIRDFENCVPDLST